MPRGASAKREHEYEELVEEFEEEGRYQGREEEVAARIVNKQRAEQGETKQAKREDRTGHSPDRNLPLPGFDALTIDQITGKLEGLSHQEIEQIRRYEQEHRKRKTLLEQLDRQLEVK